MPSSELEQGLEGPSRCSGVNFSCWAAGRSGEDLESSWDSRESHLRRVTATCQLARSIIWKNVLVALRHSCTSNDHLEKGTQLAWGEFSCFWSITAPPYVSAWYPKLSSDSGEHFGDPAHQQMLSSGWEQALRCFSLQLKPQVWGTLAAGNMLRF